MTMPVIDIPAGITPEQAALYASTATFDQQQQQLRNQLAAVVALMWTRAALSGAFGPVDAIKFVANLLPVALGAQRTMAALTVAYYNRVLVPRSPVTVPFDAMVGQALRGKDPGEYYRRPFTEVRWRLSQGKTLEQAVDFGRRRIEAITATDLQLAHTFTARRWIEEANRRAEAQRELYLQDDLQRQRDTQLPGQDALLTPDAPPPTELLAVRVVTGYRRVLSNRPNHCALCILASTQRYKRADLMPIHPQCSCTVLPVFDIEPRSDQRVLDPELAQQIHNTIRSDLGEKYVNANARDAAAQYRDIVVTNYHGEIGPVLGVRGQHFETDPNKPGHLGHDRVNPPDQKPNVQELG